MTMENCRQCRCKDGIVLCDQVQCENPSCEWLSLNQGDCCTTCQGMRHTFKRIDTHWPKREHFKVMSLTETMEDRGILWAGYFYFVVFLLSKI